MVLSSGHARVAVALMSALLVVSLAGPVSAHDQLIASTPSSGERLATAPSEVILQFSQDVLTMGVVVMIVDESGRDWTRGEPVVDLNRVTVAVDEAMPPAGYEIRWRVVSSDGHPISDLLRFTVGDGEPFTAAAAEVVAPEDPGAQTQTQAEPSTIWRTLSIGAIGAVLALSLFALITFIRRRLPRSDGGASTSD
jgi:methionine-rich copper-binding protein CopC